ncbi:Membrane protein insertase YidC [Buchnera aphidicola (Phyllaphis fagi)]|uniref:membrane protein insertase YidC n=1 Tax=Buchnera aphidicola TaxID=9 RepID=UPI00346422C3
MKVLQRNFFIFLFLLFSFLLWKMCYIKAHSVKMKDNILSNNLKSIQLQDLKNQKYLIYIKTNVIDLIINLHTGNIESVKLLVYQKQLNSFKKIKLLQKYNLINQINNKLLDNNIYYKNINANLNYTSSHIYYKLVNGRKILYVPIQFILGNGIIFLKTFIFKESSYNIDIKYKVINSGPLLLKFSIFGELQYNTNTQINKNILKNKNLKIESFKNMAYSSEYEKYNRCSLDNIINNKNLYLLSNFGWISIFQKYFLISWIFYFHEKSIIYTSCFDYSKAIIGYKSPDIAVYSGSMKVLQTTLWIGPKIQNKMSHIAPYLDCTVDYGWLWFLSKPFFTILSILYNFVGNWGYSIILMTFLIRIIIYPLTKFQYLSMIKMKILEPKIQDLQIKFRNNKIQLNQEILNLYKNECVNPLGSFFPVLIQMPFFLALYYTLANSVELRHTPFMFWIHDLSGKDPLYILPVLMGITMLFIQHTAPNNTINFTYTNKVNFIPLIFILFFLWFPSGLVLYYTVSNIVTIIQQIIINRNNITKNKNT